MSDKKSKEALEALEKKGGLIDLLQERNKMLREALDLLDKENSKIIGDEIVRNNDLLTSSLNTKRNIENGYDWKKSYQTLIPIIDKNSNSLSNFNIELGEKPQTRNLSEKFSGFWKTCVKSIASVFTSPKIDLSDLQKLNEGLKKTLDSYVAAHPKQKVEPFLSADEFPSDLPPPLYDNPDLPPPLPIEPARSEHTLPTDLPPPLANAADLPPPPPLYSDFDLPPPPPIEPVKGEHILPTDLPPPLVNATLEKPSANLSESSKSQPDQENKTPELKQPSPQRSSLLDAILKGANLKNSDDRKLNETPDKEKVTLDKITSRRDAIRDDNEDLGEKSLKKLTPREEILDAAKNTERWKGERAKIDLERAAAAANKPQESRAEPAQTPIQNSESVKNPIPEAPPLPPPAPPPPNADKPKQSWVEKTGSTPKVESQSKEVQTARANTIDIQAVFQDRLKAIKPAAVVDKDISRYALASRLENQADALSTSLSKGRLTLLEDLIDPQGKSQLPKDLGKFIGEVTKATNKKIAAAEEWGKEVDKSPLKAFQAVSIEKWQEIQVAKAKGLSMTR